MQLANIQNIREIHAPHLVICGAGASVQAFPEGDKYGSVLPVMNDLVPMLALDGVLDDAGIEWRGHNFEALYSLLLAEERYSACRDEIENRIAEYFSKMYLPETPTIYDYLILSLRDKDCIATFNWDPFLFLAYLRSKDVASLPVILFLHGCAHLGYCMADREIGPKESLCSKCGNRYTPTQLLYPVHEKDYETDPQIASQWDTLKLALNHAFVVTVFGYSAPESDRAAIDAMSNAWGDPLRRHLEQFEIIDILPEDELVQRWRRFIHTHHYQVTPDYFTSSLAHFPRRTCEAVWEENMEIHWLDRKPIPRFDTLNELHEWITTLSSHETHNK